MDSILTSIKKLLGITEEYEYFDADIIMHINSVFSILHQMGVGPDTPFYITDDTATWDQFIPDDSTISVVKTYVYQRVKYLFDPPTTSFNLEAIKNTISELDWRISVMVNSANYDKESSNSVEEEPDG